MLSEKGAAAVTPAVRNASAGAVAHLRVARVDLVKALESLDGRGVRLVALDAEGETSVFDTDLTGPLCVVVGGESQGVRQPIARRCHTTVRLPMLGKVASLNAAVAGSIVLYEALRQRG
jgi:23S rRNA (guanosine2251-2'-O)-methyltransferase